MSARENILEAIKNNKPALSNLPEIDLIQVTNYDNLVEKFTTTLESIGGHVQELSNYEMLGLIISEERASGNIVLNALDGETDLLNPGLAATDLEAVDKVYVKGSIAVAENGAIWIGESQMVNRLLPFIGQHLVVVLEKEKLVATMHHAYQQVNTFKEGFGVFIAGPSKTADIEQSLVIGAHGARSLTVYFLH